LAKSFHKKRPHFVARFSDGGFVVVGRGPGGMDFHLDFSPSERMAAFWKYAVCSV